MALKLMGKKRGMTQRFDSNGNSIACTVIEIEPNIVTQIRTEEVDGYTAIQAGFESVKAKDPRRLEQRVGKPRMGSFKKKGLEPKRYLLESRLEKVDDYALGQELKIDALASQKYVDVCGISKGKGYQGVMKLHGYSGIGRSHGTGPVHRHAGSIGMRSTPGRCLPGGKRASRMGGRRKTVQSLEIVYIDAGRNLLLVKGAVPGAIGALVAVSPAKKLMGKVV